MSSVQGWAVFGPEGEIALAYSGDVDVNLIYTSRRSVGADIQCDMVNELTPGHTVKPVTIATECRWTRTIDGGIPDDDPWYESCEYEQNHLLRILEKYCPYCGGRVVVNE